MFSFFRRNKTDYPLPAWAAFFNAEQYNMFLDRLKRYFDKEKIPFILGDGEIEVRDSPFGAERMGIVNLAQVCKLEPARRWRNIITSHFTKMREGFVFQIEFDQKAHSFDYVKNYLAVRLYSKEYLSYTNEEAIIGKPVADDIVAILVFDLPNTVVNVNPEQTIQWNKTYEELFEWGQENTRKNNPVKILTEIMGELTVRLITSSHFFVANSVLDLAGKPGLVGSNGSLVGIPHRHAVLIYPIENLDVTTAISKLVPVIKDLFKEGPGSISPNLYWYHDNELTTLPYELSDEKLKFYPPEEFMDMLNTLEAKG